MSSSTDCRGVSRGKCSVCDCDQYDGGSEGMRCIMMNCDHPPGKHLNINRGSALLAQLTSSQSLSPTSMGVNTDGVSSSLSQPSFDLNTGLDFDTDDELSQAMRKDDSVTFIQSLASSVSLSAVSVDQQCILSGCTRKKYTDPQTGFVHNFCSKSHAREHEEQNCKLFTPCYKYQWT